MTNEMRKLIETVELNEADLDDRDIKILNSQIGSSLTFQELCARQDEFGIVVTGAGGKLTDWAKGLSENLVESRVSETDQVFSEYGHITGNNQGDRGRTDAYFFFNKDNELNVGKLSMWRLRIGDISWIDDFCVNYAKDYI